MAQPPATELATERLKGRRVLVVDDQADALELTSSLIARTGAHVDRAASAWEALDKAKTLSPDLIVCDIGMPEMDGYGFIRALREWERERNCSPVPAVALTAFAYEKDRDEALRSGFQAHLTKPVAVEELLRISSHLAA